MKNLTEIVKRPNVHQTHFCDLVLLGNEGLEELNDKIDRFLKTKQHQDVGLNVSTKIDGSPAVICFSSFEGYPDSSICLKSFVNNANNCLSSEDEINDKYGDRPEMAEKLKFCLELSHYIPAGEAWQGDCLFTQMDLKEQDINGIKYLTFHPNKIVYAFSEDNPNYSKVKNADFGIAFHTIYKDDGEGGKKQSFRVDPTRLNAPDNFYIMSPAIDTSNIKFDDDKINELYDDLLEAEKDLMYDQDYEDLVHNEAFMKYWNTYENASLADKKAVNINVDNLTEDLLDYIKDKKEKEFTKKLSTLKTDKGRQSATEKYNQELAELENIISTNREVLLNMVKALNLAANIKMEMWKGYKNANTGVSTFYRSKTRGFFPASMEGIAMSDSDGNIIKIVDRSEFSSANRDPDIMSGWEHPEDLRESITALKDIRLNEDIQRILNILNEAAAKAPYKVALKSIAKYIKDNLENDDSFRFPQSSRHDDEVCRIDFAKTVENENLVPEKIKEIFEEVKKDNLYEIPNINSGDSPIYVKTDFTLGPGPSGTYQAIKLEITYNDEQFPDAYITDATHRTDGKKSGAKKMFTPNQVLSSDLFDDEPKTKNQVIEGVKYKSDKYIEDLLVALVKAAKNATTSNKGLAKYLTTRASERSDIKPSSSNLSLSFESTSELDEAIKALKNKNPSALERLNNAIGVDFGEVFGSIALATVLEKYGSSNSEMLIKFPSESNCPLVDYFIEPKDKLQDFKISAKAGVGGKPTVSAPCATILRMVNKEWGSEKEALKTRYAEAIEFTKWLQKCIEDSKNVHNSFELLEKGLLTFLKIEDGEPFTFLDEDVAILLTLQKEYIEEIVNLKASYDNLKTLVRKTNDVINSIVLEGNDISYIQESGIWSKDKIDGMKTENNLKRYFESLKTKCLVTILINAINNSSLIMDFNDLFNMSFGTFIQIYFKQITMDVGSTYSFDAVVKSIDGQDIVGKDVYYKLNFDCAISKDSGLFTVKSLALKLNHKS